jgi:hypothetical protein
MGASPGATPGKSDPPAKGNPHGGPPGQDDVKGIGNRRKADGTQPGKVGNQGAAADAKKDDKAPGAKDDPKKKDDKAPGAKDDPKKK